MYLWNTKNLINDFQQQNVTQKETLKYLLFFFMGMVLKNMCFEMSTGLTVPASSALSNKAMVTTYLVIGLITILGIYLCYRKNYQGDDNHFVERFICLTIPVNIRLFFLAVLYFMGQYFLKFIIKEKIYEIVFESGAYIFSVTITLEVIFYIYMIYCFDEIGSGLASQNATTIDVN